MDFILTRNNLDACAVAKCVHHPEGRATSVAVALEV